MTDQSRPVWLSRRHQADRFRKSLRTIERWGQKPKLGMPPEVEINGRWYRRLDQLEQWESMRPTRAATSTAAAEI
jgi:hypothetical protein